MEWVLLGLVLGSAVCSARILADYMARERDLRARQIECEERAQALNLQAEAEGAALSEAREQVTGLRKTVDELHERVARLRPELQAQRNLSRRVELTLNRHELRSRRKVLVG
ncbi:MAG: hypothetical protein QGI83_19100 [Candidatus Latescibacteria bacterium]|jgi:phage shock protein A|nr:hypothetical protein [Candidatus Latescibacterota bacterium]